MRGYVAGGAKPSSDPQAHVEGECAIIAAGDRIYEEGMLMIARVRMPTGLIGLACSGVLLSACGGSSTKISDASFVTHCTHSTSIAASPSQCRCLQRKLVAQGHGNLDYTAKSEPPKVELAAVEDARACGLGQSPPVTGGGGTGTGTT